MVPDVTCQDTDCRLERVYLGSDLWSAYVEASVAYLVQEWPAVLQNTSRQAFRGTYERTLAQRLQEGGRYLVFCVERGQRVGLANLYTDRFESGSTQPKEVGLALYVAEFQVAPQSRRQGTGRRFVQRLCDLAHALDCRALLAEVDTDRGGANAFWSSVLGDATLQNGRNVYIAAVATPSPAERRQR